MTRALAFAVLCLCLPAAAWPVTFLPQPLRVGHAESEITHFEMVGALDGSSGGVTFNIPFSSYHDERIELEVLATGDALPTKIRVRYPKSEEKSTFGDQTEDKKAAMGGKSYLVEKRDGQVTVTREDGAALEAEEDTELTQYASLLEQPSRACDGLTGRDWKVGDKADLQDPGIASILHMSGDQDLEHFQLVLREVRPALGEGGKGRKDGAQVAVFDVTLRFRGKSAEGADITMPLSGELAVEAPSCRVLSFDGSGPMEMSATTESEGQKMELKGKALAKLSMRGEYKP